MGSAVSTTTYLISLPVEFLHWWFIESFFNLLKIIRWTLALFYRLLGVRLLLKTFFKPWKNEYREGLVRFSIFMGIFFKSLFLVFDLLFFAAVILVQFLVLTIWFLLPFLVFWGIHAAFFT